MAKGSKKFTPGVGDDENGVLAPSNDIMFHNFEKGDVSKYIRHAKGLWELDPIDLADERQVQERIGWFFDYCMKADMKPTMSGLAMALGIESRSLRRWASGEQPFSSSTSIKKATEFLENLWENYMLNGKVNPVTGIFIAKNQFGYKDRSESVVSLEASAEHTPEELTEQATILPDDYDVE